MARPAIPSAKKKEMIAEEPPKKKEQVEQVMPLPAAIAAKVIGYDKLMKSKGKKKSQNTDGYRKLYKEVLDDRQRCLIMVMKGKNKVIKKGENPEPAYVTPREDGEYVVERILNSKREKGVLKYQVLWEGYPLEMASWEPIDNLVGDNAEVVADFHKEFVGKPGDPTRGKNEYLDQLAEEATALTDPDAEGDIDVEYEAAQAERVDKANSNIVATPKPKQTKTRPVVDASRPVGVGGKAAQAMKLIPASPKHKRTPGSAEGSRKSNRHAPQKYDTLNDCALVQGKVKKNPASYEAGLDADKTPARATATAASGGTGGSGRFGRPAVGGRNDSNDEDHDEVMETPSGSSNLFRARSSKRARGGKEKTVADKSSSSSPLIAPNSDDSIYDLSGGEADDLRRKKTKKATSHKAIMRAAPEVGPPHVPQQGVLVPVDKESFDKVVGRHKYLTMLDKLRLTAEREVASQDMANNSTRSPSLTSPKKSDLCVLCLSPYGNRCPCVSYGPT